MRYNYRRYSRAILHVKLSQNIAQPNAT